MPDSNTTPTYTMTDDERVRACVKLIADFSTDAYSALEALDRGSQPYYHDIETVYANIRCAMDFIITLDEITNRAVPDHISVTRKAV